METTLRTTRTSSPEGPEDTRFRRSRRWNVVLGAVVVFLALVAAAQLIPDASSTPTGASDSREADRTEADGTEAAAAGPEERSSADLAFVRRVPDDPMAIGDVDAPVVLTEWMDLRCPFCAVVSRDTMPALIQEYVDTGEVRIEFHDVAYFGEESGDAAVAARAAGEQGMYVEYITAVYAAAPEGGHPDMPREKLIAFAEEAGVPDIERFTADLDDPELRAALERSEQQARELGVNAVPFFVAGNTALSGAQPTAVFREFLDETLALAGAAEPTE